MDFNSIANNKIQNNSRKELHKKINCYFSKERESSSYNYRQELLEKLNDYIIKTTDGSYTLNSPDFDGKVETMHNSNGAITESFEKFVMPFKDSYIKNKCTENQSEKSNVFLNGDKNSDEDRGNKNRNKYFNFEYKNDIAILDICSGLGYNSSALISDFLENTGSKSEETQECLDSAKLSIDLLEISIETLAIGLLIPSPIESHDIIKKAIELKLIDEGFAKLNLEKTEIPKNIDINIFCEDGRKTILNLPDNSYDAIFLDPYSPAMAPEVCTVEFFRELKRVIKSDGIVATYSLAAPLRFAFIEAGFYIGEGPIFGRKSGGTLASLNINNISKTIPLNDERTISLSDAGIPYRDENLNLTSSQILENRASERKIARHNTRISSAVQSALFLGKEVEDEKLKRRILRNCNEVNISSLQSKEAYYIIYPQKNHNKELNIHSNSNKRIIEMNNRLLDVIDKKSI